MFRRLTIMVARGLAALSALVVLLALGALFVLESGVGRSWIETLTTDLSRSAGYPVTVEGLRGRLPFGPEIAKLTVGDADGVWLEVYDLALSVSAGALLDRELVVDRLEAARINVIRAPLQGDGAAAEEIPATDAAPLGIPGLPVSVRLDRLHVTRLDLGAALAGTEVVATVDAHAALSRAGEGGVSVAVGLSRPVSLNATLDLDTTADLDTRQEVTVKTDLASLRGALATFVPTLDGALTERLAALPDGPVTLDAKAAIDVSAGDVTVDALALRVGSDETPIALDGTARLVGWGAEAEAALTLTSPDVAPWLAVAGPMAAEFPDGPLRLVINLEGSPRNGDLRVGAVNLALGPDAARVILDADARAEDWGALVDAKVRLSVTEVAPWVAAAAPATGSLPEGLPLDGPLEVTLEAAGGMAETVRGRLDASLDPVRHPALSVKGDVVIDPNAAGGMAVTVSDLTAKVGGNVVTGAVAAKLGDAPSANGELKLDLPRLAELAALAGRGDIAGALRGGLTLKGGDGVQGVAAKLTLADVSAPGAAVGGLTLDVSAKDVLGAPTVSAKIGGREIKAGEFAVGAVDLTANGGLNVLDFTLDAKNVGPEKAGLTAKGSLARDAAAPAPGLTVRLAEMALTARGQRIRLSEPATVTVAGTRVAVDRLRLEGAGARLSAGGGLDGETLDATWRLERFPLTLLGLIDPSLNGSGEVVGSGTVSGTTTAPIATAEATLKGVSMPQMVAAGLKPIDGSLNGRWNGAGGDASGALEAKSRDGLVKVSAKGGMRGNGTLDAKVNGMVDLRVLDVLLATSGDRARGVPRFDLSIGGTATAPSIKGAITMEGGSYDNVASGLSLTKINLKVTGAGEKARIERLTAITNGGGGLSASGDVVLTDGPRFDIKLKADNATLADTALATVIADANLTLVGRPDDARVGGTVTLPKVEIRIPRRLPPSVTALEVVEVGGGRPPMEEPSAAAPPEPVGAGEETRGVALDVTVSAPRRVLVSGQGFDGEFGGDVKVMGTAAVPDVTGRFGMLRGTLDVLGRRVTFTRGNLFFDGGPVIDPRLDVSASLGDAVISVTGSPRRPDISFSSATGLPQDEVVSNMLFGKTSDKLTAGEAIQLASALADLAGFGGDSSILGSFKSRLGLDALDLGTDTDGRTEVRAGSYLGDGVFVGIEQSAVGVPRGRVEVDLTDNLKAQAGVGPDGEPEIGIGFEMDY